MDNVTFMWGDARLTVRRSTMRDRLRREVVIGRLAQLTEDDSVTHWETLHFARAITQTVIEGDIGFVIPPSTCDDDELLAAFEAWGNLSGAGADEWLQAIKTTMRPMVDDTLAPGAEEAAKKAVT